MNINPKIALRALIGPLIPLAILLLSAGRVDYWQAWLYLALSVAGMLMSYLTLRKRPELIAERFNPGEGMKAFDKLFFALTTPLYFAQLIVAGLDVGRFGWTGPLPVWVYALAVLVFLVGQAGFAWAKATNAYFSSVVRIQSERGHSVCQDGPYRRVRHPGYAFSLLFMLAGALALGSVYAVIPQVLGAGLLFWRTANEDRTLQAELPGYSDYARTVKFRLLPGIW